MSDSEAARVYAARQRATARPRRSYEALYPACSWPGCDEEPVEDGRCREHPLVCAF